MSPSTTLATVATGALSKLRSKPPPAAAGCGRGAPASVISVPWKMIGCCGLDALEDVDVPPCPCCCGKRGEVSSERTLSMTSRSVLLELTVAGLQDASAKMDDITK